MLAEWARLLRRLVISLYGLANAAFLIVAIVVLVREGYAWWWYVILGEAIVIAAMAHVIWQLRSEKVPQYGLAEQAAERRALRDELQRRIDHAQALSEKARRAFDAHGHQVWDSWKKQAEDWTTETAAFIDEHVGAAETAQFLKVPVPPVPSDADREYNRCTEKLYLQRMVLSDIINRIPISG